MTHEEYLVPIKPNRGWAGLPESSKIMYKERYFQPDEDYEIWLDRVCRAFTDSREHRGRMKQYIRNYWFHPATPVSANAGLPQQGYPVSCFVNQVEDSKDGIFSSWEETFYLASRGAGVGTDWSFVRSAGEKVGTTGKSSGIIPFLKVDESMVLAVSQGGVRRGSKAVYLHISHPEIEEFIQLKDPTGDPYRRTPQLFTGVVVDDEFLAAVEKREKYFLRSPKTGEVLKEVDAFELWNEILYQRMLRGVPYILFIDNVNSQRPIEYVEKNMNVTTSNLCSEIVLHTRPDYSNICVLSSINLEFWDEITENEKVFETFMEDIHRFLDNVLQSFIDNAKGERGFEKTVKAAEYERSIGLGVMGFHYLLQKKRIPFESIAAKHYNKQIFSKIKETFDKTNEKLANEKGACPLAKEVGTNKRNIHVTAIAPTASISILCNHTSPSIEPLVKNIYTHKTNVGTFIIKNRYLEKLLEEKGANTEETWMQILADGGSVKNLDILTEEEKEVFKTAYEINQQIIIDFAGDRQPYIDQAQSVNLFIAPPADREYLYDLHMFAWVRGVKSLYYVRSEPPKPVGKFELKSADDAVKALEQLESNQQKFEECLWCQ